MKRLFVLSVLSLTATFLFTTLAAGAAGPVASKTTSKVSPSRDRTAPYKFKTEGEVKFPERSCKGNATGPNCIPRRICPPGTSNYNYCFKPDDDDLCQGTVTVVFRTLSGTILSSQTVPVEEEDDDDCEYEVRTTIGTQAKMTVTATFSGNAVLAASSASPKSARAG